MENENRAIPKTVTFWNNIINKTKCTQLSVVVAYSISTTCFCLYLYTLANLGKKIDKRNNLILECRQTFSFRLLRAVTLNISSPTAVHSITVEYWKKYINPTRLFKWHVLRIVNDEYIHVANKFLPLHLIFIWLVGCCAHSEPMHMSVFYTNHEKWNGSSLCGKNE